MKTIMGDEAAGILEQLIDCECSDYVQAHKIGVEFKPSYTDGLVQIADIIRAITNLPDEAMVVMHGSTHVLEVALHGTCVYRRRRVVSRYPFTPLQDYVQEVETA